MACSTGKPLSCTEPQRGDRYIYSEIEGRVFKLLSSKLEALCAVR